MAIVDKEVVDKEVVGAELLNTYLVGAANGRLTIVQMLEGDLAGSEYVIRGLEYPEVKIVHREVDDESEWTHISNLEFVRFENDPEKHPLLVAWKENPDKRIIVALACDPQQKPVGWISDATVDCIEVIPFGGDDKGVYGPHDYELDDLVILRMEEPVIVTSDESKGAPTKTTRVFMVGADVDDAMRNLLDDSDFVSAAEVAAFVLPALTARIYDYLNTNKSYSKDAENPAFGAMFTLAKEEDDDEVW